MYIYCFMGLSLQYQNTFYVSNYIIIQTILLLTLNLYSFFIFNKFVTWFLCFYKAFINLNVHFEIY